MNALPTWRYRTVLRLVSPLVLLHCLWRTVKDGGWRYLKQRLGFIANDQHARIHVHAASVGEVITVLPLIERIQSEHAKAAFLVTTNTPTGASILHKRLQGNAVYAYLPLDFAGATKRFLNRQNIIGLWIVETEIWPWLFARAKMQSIPISIINARLGHRSSGVAATFFEQTYRGALSGINVLARSTEDAQRYEQRGAQADKIRTLGNLKLAQTQDGSSVKRLLDMPYVLAASTHDDEELMLAQACLQSSIEQLLVIVPRHVERGPRLQKSLQALQNDIDPQLPTIALRSLGQQPSLNSKIYLADTLGELTDWYAHADIAFVGGSLIKRGGHNVLEPARQGTPIVVGPHTFNFAEEVNALKNIDAIAIANNVDELHQLISLVSSDEQWAISMGMRAKDFINTHSDILDIYCESLLQAVAHN